MINARVETVAERPAFRRAFERYRCLIVADGFYEWQPSGSRAAPKQPFHITRDDGELFAFAGLWSIWYGPDERKLRTCTILTTAANSAIAPLHDRMPVILAPEHEQAWLDTATPRDDLHELLGGLSASADRAAAGRARGQRRPLRRSRMPGAAGRLGPGGPVLATPRC